MAAAGINRRLPIEVTTSLLARMANRVDKAGPDDCWNWTASFRNGYGAIKHQGKVLQAHRVAYVIEHGEPDDGLIIGHKCDNRACCNPSHIEAITPGQNNRDAFERLERKQPIGEEQPNAVLNEQLVARAWSLKRTGMSGRAIARELGVDHKTLGNVFLGRNWKHLIPSWAKQPTT